MARRSRSSSRWKHAQQARRRLPGAFEQAHGGLVGALLLRAAVAQKRLLRHCLAAAQDGAPHLAFARDDGAGRQHRRQDHLGRSVLHRVPRANQVAAGDVADLVREHADDLAGVLGGGQHAARQEKIGAAGDEGVDVGVVDDVQPDRVFAEARSLQQWRGIGPDGIFDLGVADQRHALRPRRRRCRQDQ